VNWGEERPHRGKRRRNDTEKQAGYLREMKGILAKKKRKKKIKEGKATEE